MSGSTLASPGSPTQGAAGEPLRFRTLETPLGAMFALSGVEHLLLLAFTDQRGAERHVARLKGDRELVEGDAPPITMLETEIEEYFAGVRSRFETPILLSGTDFQERVWRELLAIPPGATRTYGELATAAGNPRAHRAAASANGANRLSIIVPCHRVVGVNGSLGGYAGGVSRKRWLLEHEQAAFPQPGGLF